MTADTRPPDVDPIPAAIDRDLRLINASVAFIWLITGCLLVHPYFRMLGTAQLAAIGLPPWLMGATCLFEVILGILLLRRGMTLPLAAIQVALILGFSAILIWQDPRLLVHPFGVLTKNVPLLAMIVTAALVTRRGWTGEARWILRIGLALIWITEGLFPKVLFQQPSEVAVVAHSAFSFGDPATFLRVLGLAQVAAGLAALLLRGRLLLLIYAGQILGLTVLPLLVSWQDPMLWFHPYGPMTKNLPILAGTYVLYRRCRSSS